MMNTTTNSAADSTPALSIADQIKQIEELQKYTLQSRFSVAYAKALDAKKQILLRKQACNQFAEQALQNAKPKSFIQKLFRL